MLILLVADVIVSDLYEATTIIDCFFCSCVERLFCEHFWIRKRASRLIWKTKFYLCIFLYGGRSTLISNGSPVLFYRHCPSLEGSLGTSAASLSMEQEVARLRKRQAIHDTLFLSFWQQKVRSYEHRVELTECMLFAAFCSCTGYVLRETCQYWAKSISQTSLRVQDVSTQDL